jgi:hypothetical protein
MADGNLVGKCTLFQSKSPSQAVAPYKPPCVHMYLRHCQFDRLHKHLGSYMLISPLCYEGRFKLPNQYTRSEVEASYSPSRFSHFEARNGDVRTLLSGISWILQNHRPRL